MFHSDDPYGQSSLPYESYTEYSDPFPSQQQAFEKLSPSPRARPSLVMSEYIDAYKEVE